jgi:hypothetical protein
VATPWDDDSEQTSFFHEEAPASPVSDGYQNSNNLANIQQWPADEWCFSADDECQSTDLWVEIASTEQPLIANGPPNFVQEDVIVDWWEGYEDPLVPDFEWSGPIQPNAPPVDQPTADPWDFDAEFVETSATADGYQNADVIASQSQPLDVEWQDEDGEDFWFVEDVLGAGVIPAATIVADDPWSFEADYVEPTVTTEGFQNADVVTASASQPADPDWSEEDGAEDYELQIDDFANFELDPPQPDGWDWDNEAVEDSADTDQALGADVIPPAAQPLDIDWDFTESSDDDWSFDDAQQSSPVVTADQHFGDDAENWDDSAVDESDGTRPDDYQLVNVVTQPIQIFDDPWDWNEDADAELLGFDAQVPADVITPSDLAQPDGYDWDEDATESADDLSAPVGPDLVLPTSQFTDDAWDWSEESAESTDEFSSPVGDDLSQFLDDAWEWFWGAEFAEVEDQLDPALSPDTPFVLTLLSGEPIPVIHDDPRITPISDDRRIVISIDDRRIYPKVVN